MSVNRKEFHTTAYRLLRTPQLQSLKKYKQHGNTTFEHTRHVLYCAERLASMLPMSFSATDLAVGCVFHDFYLYQIGDGTVRLHGFKHPLIALHHAKEIYPLTQIEENMILSHMFPLTLRSLPKSREAVLLGIVDKYCAVKERIYCFFRLKSKL